LRREAHERFDPLERRDHHEQRHAGKRSGAGNVARDEGEGGWRRFGESASKHAAKTRLDARTASKKLARQVQDLRIAGWQD
jgi:hypothetical protein